MTRVGQIQNMFVDIIDGFDESSKVPKAILRSNSLPRSWKPVIPRKRILWSDVMSDSGDSTEAPDGSSIDDGTQSGVEQTEWTRGHEPQLEDPAPICKVEATRTRGPKQYHKKPVPVVSTEFVLGVLRYFLCNCMCVQDVSVEESEGSEKSEVRIIAELSNDSVLPAGAVEDWILEPARQALLAACMDSDNCYILGYAMQPFRSYHDLGFKCTLVTAATNEHVCWDIFQYGTCSRPSCRWRHPDRGNSVELTLQVKIAIA